MERNRCRLGSFTHCEVQLMLGPLNAAGLHGNWKNLALFNRHWNMLSGVAHVEGDVLFC